MKVKKLLMKLKSLPFTVSIFLGAMLLNGTASGSDLWRCVAQDARGARWVQYAPTRAGAAASVALRCRRGSLRPTCTVRCFPPTERWRCVSRDNAGKKWYWVANTKPKALANARRVCIYNSRSGGCYVNAGACSL